MTMKVGLILMAIACLPASAFAGALDDNLQSALRDAYAIPAAELTLSVQLDAPVSPELQPFADNARFANLMLDKTSGRFSVIALLLSGAPVAQLPLSGRCGTPAMAEVPVLRDMVTRGQLVGPDLVDDVPVPANRLAGGFVVDVADLVGKAARRTLHPAADPERRSDAADRGGEEQVGQHGLRGRRAAPDRARPHADRRRRRCRHQGAQHRQQPDGRRPRHRRHHGRGRPLATALNFRQEVIMRTKTVLLLGGVAIALSGCMGDRLDSLGKAPSMSPMENRRTIQPIAR